MKASKWFDMLPEPFRSWAKERLNADHVCHSLKSAIQSGFVWTLAEMDMWRDVCNYAEALENASK